MATTEERLRPAHEPEAILHPDDGSPPDQRPAPVVDDARRLLWAWGVAVAAMWILEPAPADPNAPIQAVELLVGVGFMAAVTAAIAGLVRKAPWGFWASGAAAGIGMAAAIACPVTGHHTGTFWMWEAAAFAGLAAMTWHAARARPMES